MKYLLIISCLLFTSVGWSKSIDNAELIKRDGLYYEKFTDAPFNGTVTGLQTGNITKGKKEGKWLWFYYSGQLREKTFYVDGKKEGERLWYRESGEVKIIENYKKGKLTGESMWYHSNGKLQFKVYYKNGEIDGEYLEYYDSGKLISKKIYKDGKLIETIEH